MDVGQLAPLDGAEEQRCQGAMYRGLDVHTLRSLLFLVPLCSVDFCPGSDSEFLQMDCSLYFRTRFGDNHVRGNHGKPSLL